MKQEIELPYSKLWTVEGPRIDVQPGEVIIKYDHKPGGGEAHEVEIRFSIVLAYKYTDESCYRGPLDFVADGVVRLDIDDSEWLAEVKRARDQFFRPGTVLYERFGQFDFYHFGVWFGEEGTYEVIARNCVITAGAAMPRDHHRSAHRR